MVATDNDGGFQFATFNHFVELQTRPVAVTKSDPANSRRQALKRNPLPCHVKPVVKMCVVWKQLLHRLIGPVDILRIARQGAPSERTDPLAEQRSDIGRNKTWKCKGVLQPFLKGNLANIIAIIQSRHTVVPEIYHRLHMRLH